MMMMLIVAILMPKLPARLDSRKTNFSDLGRLKPSIFLCLSVSHIAIDVLMLAHFVGGFWRKKTLLLVYTWKSLVAVPKGFF